MCHFIQALIERGDEAANQPVDDEDNTFLHVAARSGALRSVQVRDTVAPSNVVNAAVNPTGSNGQHCY